MAEFDYFDFNDLEDYGTRQPGVGETAQGKGFDWFGDAGVLMPAMKGLGSLFEGMAAWRTAKDQKKAFNFNMGLAKTNLANTAKMTNSQIEDNARAVGRQRGYQGDQLASFVRNTADPRKVSGTIGS
jgi:hypothetical protein